MVRISDQDLKRDVKGAAITKELDLKGFFEGTGWENKFNWSSEWQGLTQTDYRKISKYSSSTIGNRFAGNSETGGWSHLKEELNLSKSSKTSSPFKSQEMIEAIKERSEDGVCLRPPFRANPQQSIPTRVGVQRG